MSAGPRRLMDIMRPDTRDDSCVLARKVKTLTVHERGSEGMLSLVSAAVF